MIMRIAGRNGLGAAAPFTAPAKRTAMHGKNARFLLQISQGLPTNAGVDRTKHADYDAGSVTLHSTATVSKSRNIVMPGFYRGAWYESRWMSIPETFPSPRSLT